MSAENRLLHLKIAQAEKALGYNSNNKYSNKNLSQYQQDLNALLSRIKDDVESGSIESGVVQKRLAYIFKSLEYLSDSTLNLIPHELIYVLGHALSDWLPESESKKYIIVTTLSNNIDTFQFNPWMIREGSNIENDINIAYDISFSASLIQVTLPKTLVRDYLASIVLFHELGHFIDEYYGISKRIAKEIADALYNEEDIGKHGLADFFHVLPEGKKTDLSAEKRSNINKQFQFYWAEYFCDLFAAQYLGDGYMQYLAFVAVGKPHSEWHPSTQTRQRVYEDFLNEKPNPIVDIFQKYMPQLCNENKFKKRFEPIPLDDFFNFLPAEISTIPQLYGVFALGWEVWLGNWTKYEDVNNLSYPLVPENAYSIINNLMEKSIGNYIAKDLWNKNSQKPS